MGTARGMPPIFAHMAGMGAGGVRSGKAVGRRAQSHPVSRA